MNDDEDPSPRKTSLYCGLKQLYLSFEYMKRHNCLARRKGRNRGRRCPYLIENTGGSYVNKRSEGDSP
jgi:hypothetical protein